MTIRTPRRARTGTPARLDQAPHNTTAPTATTPRTRMPARIGALAVSAALTFTLAPTLAAHAVGPVTNAPVAAAATAVPTVKKAATVHLSTSKKRWVEGKRTGKVTAKIRTGATTPSGSVSFFDGHKRLAKKTVKANGKVSYRLPRKLAAKKHTIRAVFQPSGVAATAVTSGRDSLKVRVVSEGAHIARIAKKYVGVRYRAGGGSPAGFDCSGFTSYVFKKAGVAKLPKSSSAQRHSGKTVSRSKARAGDIIWTRGHVAIYLGNGKQIDAPRPGKSIQVRSIWQANPTFIRV